MVTWWGTNVEAPLLPFGNWSGVWNSASQCGVSVRTGAHCQRASARQRFFHREGVLNGNLLSAPASDEFDLVRSWQRMAADHQVALNVCVAAALRRGVIDETEAHNQGHGQTNLQPGFHLTGLGSLAEASLTCDRMVQF